MSTSGPLLPGQHIDYGPDMPAGDVPATFTEVDELHDEVLDQSSDLGRWALAWGLIAVVFALLLHGPVLFVGQLVLCGAAFVCWLLCRRRARAGTPQSPTLAWLGLILALAALGLGFAGLAGHPLLGWGWSWKAS